MDPAQGLLMRSQIEVVLRELGQGRIGPLGAHPGHVEGGEYAFWFAEVVPADTADSDHRKTFGSLCQNLMRKVDFVQTVIEVTDGFTLCRSSEKWNGARRLDRVPGWRFQRRRAARVPMRS